MADGRMAILAFAIVTLSGCASAGDRDSVRASGGACLDEPGQRFIGQRNTPETGAAIMAETGATSLRWLPPGAVATTDRVPRRVTITYDENYRIMQVACG